MGPLLPARLFVLVMTMAGSVSVAGAQAPAATPVAGPVYSVIIWESAAALEAHSMAAPTRRFRDALAPATGALYDERMYRALD